MTRDDVAVPERGSSMAADERKDRGELSRPERSEPTRRNAFENWSGGAGGRWSGASGHGHERGLWAPQIEAFQRGDKYIVRVDLPGMKREDVTVEVGDEQLIIQGHRREEREEAGGGFYRSERTYGSFFRSVPLPDGSDAESAEASFRDGVLEITITAPTRPAARGRRVEIGEQRKDASEPTGGSTPGGS